ncbi:Calx-beta domain-containing protein, partial [Belnapia moabensis]|uniref:Calx-beta domain-containing protein n=1 Tax=Belnapia moabensis TaxID=365533 RepID=UPI0005B94CEC
LGFTVTLDAPTTSTVTVAYTTATGGTAAASDFTATAGTLSFAPNETSKTVAVPTVEDSAVELNETLFFNLSDPTGAALADAAATGTIINDDSAPIVVPGMRVSDVSVTEGGVLNFAVTLSAASTAPITVNYSTANGTAIAPADYTAASGTLTFAPQQTRIVVAVGTTDETAYENNETMFLRLTGPSGATLVDAEGQGLINNNDVAGRTITGTSGSNLLTGGGGDDVITGGRGNDTMTGGAGADDFRLTRLDGFDRIRDFAPGLDDLVFSGIASSSVQVRTGSYAGVTGSDVFYGTSGDHVFLQGVTPARFSIATDAVFV